MKRSQINTVIRDFEKMLTEYRIALPPFCHWTPEEWEDKGHEYDEIRDNMLGWDVTDYGEGHFDTLGLALITLRNGNFHNPKYNKPYAEKLLFVKDGQVSPMHFHFNKMEDIICKGGGNMMMRLYNSKENGDFADSDVRVISDGRAYDVPAGSTLRFAPGESITLQKGQYHEFFCDSGKGDILLGEVSMLNDDNTDNRFYAPLARFSNVEEDEPPYRLLCNEYPAAK